MAGLSAGKVHDALSRIGRDPVGRARLMACLRDLESVLARDGLDVRQEITGPLVDALHLDGEMIERTLSTGLKFAFPYRSKIAREFAMASSDAPDHVWEPQTTRLLLALAEGARHVVIGGAYFGDHAIPIAHKIQASGGVCHCFDINPEQLSVLADNAARNKLTNVVINAFGLWDRDDKRVVMVGHDSHASSKEAAQNDASAFPTISIETYAKGRAIDTIDLIMLDIEGAELMALRGAQRFLQQPPGRAPNVVFEVHRSYVDWSGGLDKAEIVAYLASFGYRLFAVRDYQGNVDMGRHPVEIVPIDDIHLEGPPHGFNMLAVKDDALPARLGLKIVPGVSPKLLFHRDPAKHQPRS